MATTGTALKAVAPSMSLAELDAKTSKTQAPRLHSLHNITVSQDEDNGDTIIRIPQRIPLSAVFASKTEKATPMVSLMPRFEDGRTGACIVPVVITSTIVDADGQETEQETVKGLRIGVFNGFVTKI